ncbi:MAG: ATP-binding protein [Cyanobacteria bacterium P01_G01_bin.39]
MSQSQSEYLEIINRNGEHLLALINDVLDLSKIEAGKIELNSHEFDLFNMLDNIRETLELYAQTKGLKLLFVYHPDTPQHIRTDERKLRQVLINLLNNAIKFTQEGAITVRVQPDSDYRLTFEVEDMGVGIAPEELNNLFKPFTQTQTGRESDQGSGLGLAISHKLVELMHGELRVHSQVGKGSTFSFEVEFEPVSNNLANQTAIRGVVGLATNQPRYRILVADDNEDHLQVVCQLLKSIGFEVKAAENGQQAIAIGRDWQPHLIFMDLQMPLLDGYQATKIIKSEHRILETIIIALSANVFESQHSQHLERSGLNFDDYLYKPFRIADLLTKIENHLGVQYIYQDLPEENYSYLMPTNFAATELDIANLELMSSQLLIEIHQAALIADYQVLQQLISEIDLEHEVIAKSLSNCLDEFRFDQIAQLAAEVLLNRQ